MKQTNDLDLVTLCEKYIKDNHIYSKERACSYFNRGLVDTYEEFLTKVADIVGYAPEPPEKE